MSDSLDTPSKKPVSEKQLAANRANAAHSTGPRSEDGKAHSARNSLKHGFAATRFTVVCVEDAQELEQLRADLIATYQPVNSQELFTIGRIALAQWSILRTSQLEASTLTVAMNDSLSNPQTYLEDELTKNLEITRPQNNGFFMAEGFRLLARQSNSLSLMLRYQAQAERLYRRSIEEFERLRKLRPELPSEPLSEDGQSDSTPVLSESAPEPTPDPRPLTPAAPAPSEPISPCGVGASAPPPPFRAASNPLAPVQPAPSEHLPADDQWDNPPALSGRALAPKPGRSLC